LLCDVALGIKLGTVMNMSLHWSWEEYEHRVLASQIPSRIRVISFSSFRNDDEIHGDVSQAPFFVIHLCASTTTCQCKQWDIRQ
jgi:hypothetical protein